MHLRALLFFFVLAPTAVAQPSVTLSPPVLGKIPNIVEVAASKARSGTLSETHGLFAFCHEAAFEEADISLIPIDAKGNPAAYSIPLKLPSAKGFPKSNHQALSAVFHPKLPLLYVWYDVTLSYTAVAIGPKGVAEEVYKLDHLLIYRIEKKQPELILSLCHGPECTWGMSGGSLAIDPAGTHLIVPNLHDKALLGSFRAGRYELDSDGLPILDEEDIKLPVAERLKVLAKRVETTGGLPEKRTAIDYVHVFPNNPFGAAHSVHIGSKDWLLAGGAYGVYCWRHDDPQCVVQHVPVKGNMQTLIGLHSTIPTLYATRGNSDHFYQMFHFDGYLSLLPIEHKMPDTRLWSAPVVYDKGKRMAIGGHHSIYGLELDAKGRVKPEVVRMPVLNPATRVLIGSERFGRIYVAVEQSK